MATTTKATSATTKATSAKKKTSVSTESYAARFKREQAEKKAGENDGGTEADNG